MEAKLLAFLERLLGERVAATDSIIVSSTQRARLIAWLNEQSVLVTFDQLRSNRIRIADLLSGGAFLDRPRDKSDMVPDLRAAPAAVSRQPPPQSRHSSVVLGIGIDIQARSSMPKADDLRTDRFYSANFSPNELAHCIQQNDPLLSLAGLWAAKEAILKAGAGTRDKNGGLAGIAIVHDSSGAPAHPNCMISISHDQGIAVGVCVHIG